jgi:hypothetical protein
LLSKPIPKGDQVSELDFHIEYFLEVPEIDEAHKIETNDRLNTLANDHNDLIGASVTVEEIAGVDNPFIYQARIVAYIKPENITVVVKRETPETALVEALSTLEQRVRDARNKRHELWKRPDLSSDMSLYELSPKEVYDTYIGETEPEKILEQGRTQIAADLMVNAKLEQESAYYAADLVLEHAQTMINNKTQHQ